MAGTAEAGLNFIRTWKWSFTFIPVEMHHVKTRHLAAHPCPFCIWWLVSLSRPLGLGSLASISSSLPHCSFSPLVPWACTIATLPITFLGSNQLSIYSMPASREPCRNNCKMIWASCFRPPLSYPSSPISLPFLFCTEPVSLDPSQPPALCRVTLPLTWVIKVMQVEVSQLSCPHLRVPYCAYSVPSPYSCIRKRG